MLPCILWDLEMVLRILFEASFVIILLMFCLLAFRKVPWLYQRNTDFWIAESVSIRRQLTVYVILYGKSLLEEISEVYPTYIYPTLQHFFYPEASWSVLYNGSESSANDKCIHNRTLSAGLSSIYEGIIQTLCLKSKMVHFHSAQCLWLWLRTSYK